MNDLILLEQGEFQRRLSKVRAGMDGVEAILVSDNANIYYLTGRVFAGYIYIPADGEPVFFVRRPVGLKGNGVIYIRKPEQIAGTARVNQPATLGLELDILSCSMARRILTNFPNTVTVNASPILQMARSVKTQRELDLIRQSGIKQERVYRQIPGLYRKGMSDMELQIEIERISRLEGCLGLFRICGNSMELYMANILVGENADIPTPYDFAMGGEGLDPSLPVGCNGTIIKPGDSIMIDANGNYTGYMTDMTRTFASGELDPVALKAHQCSICICHELASLARPGVEARTLYNRAEEMAREAGLQEYFMGHRQKAGFVGHGLGIEINERPVIAPKSRDMLAAGNIMALEPKFVIPGTGAIGIENTYLISDNVTECLTNAPEEIISLE